MGGFTAIVSKSSKFPVNFQFRDKHQYDENHNSLYKLIIDSRCKIEHFTNNKFPKDKFLDENEQYIIGVEGVLLNRIDLAGETGEDNTFNIILNLYLKYGENFIKSLRGEFSGFIYSKESGSWFVFTNPTGSKRIFYFHDDNYFIFASELRDISFLLREMSYPISLDTRGAYFLLTYGYMLKDITLINEVKRLSPGMKLTLINNQLSVAEYFNLNSIDKTDDKKDQIIENIDKLFKRAVRSEFEKDKEYGYKHIATLSGGLDSRMTVLIANKLGYNSQLNFTFSQSNYLDEKISKKIASDYRHDFLFQSLDNGLFLRNIDKTVFFNDGLIVYSGAAHLLHSLENINLEKYGLFHTGQIGDAVLGSFLSTPYSLKPSVSLGAYSNMLIERVETYVRTIIDDYETEELFKFYNRGFLGALNGNYFMDIHSQCTSPFLDFDFLTYCYSIPDKYKFKQQIYLDWIAKKHPEFAAYPWEKTGVSPLKSNSYWRYFDCNFYQRMFLKFLDKLSKKMNSGMNPMDYWFNNNPELVEFIQEYYNNNIHLLAKYPELMEDSELLFNKGKVNEKLQVLTLLSAFRLHFK